MSLEEEARAANVAFWEVPSHRQEEEEVDLAAEEVGADRQMTEAGEEEEYEPTTTDGGDHTGGDSTECADRTEDDGSGNPAAKKKKKKPRKDRKPTVLANTTSEITLVSEKDVMENMFRVEGFISDEGPSMDLETAATSAGTGDGVELHFGALKASSIGSCRFLSTACGKRLRFPIRNSKSSFGSPNVNWEDWGVGGTLFRGSAERRQSTLAACSTTIADEASTSKCSESGTDAKKGTARRKRSTKKKSRPAKTSKTAGKTTEKAGVKNQEEKKADTSKSNKGVGGSEEKKTLTRPKRSSKGNDSALAKSQMKTSADGSGTTKARVIQKYLGDMYEVVPSYGHVRDLAGRARSVCPEDDFTMIQVDIGNPEGDMTFHSSASRLDFKGYQAVYEDTDNPEGEAAHQDNFEALSKLEVSAFLSHLFSEIADYRFTANMEAELDNVSAGSTEWKGLLKDYWERFNKYCRDASQWDVRKVERMLEEKFCSILFRDLGSDSRICPRYIARTLSYDEDDENEASVETPRSFEPLLLGLMPDTSEKVFLKQGPYGYYIQVGEDRKGASQKRAPLSKVKDVDSVTIEDAIGLLQYPKILGLFNTGLAFLLLSWVIKRRRLIYPPMFNSLSLILITILDSMLLWEDCMPSFGGKGEDLKLVAGAASVRKHEQQGGA
ncbi:hypothetical protein ACQ4PT_060163 [Festuca glaucescens]